jgi:hypothetical protein
MDIDLATIDCDSDNDCACTGADMLLDISTCENAWCVVGGSGNGNDGEAVGRVDGDGDGDTDWRCADERDMNAVIDFDPDVCIGEDILCE